MTLVRNEKQRRYAVIMREDKADLKRGSKEEPRALRNRQNSGKSLPLQGFLV